MSFPVYILDLGQDDYRIVFPEGKEDLNHSDFWEATVARIVAKHLHLPIEELLNLPYCQRRARINDKIVYYGEKPTKKLLKLIEKAVGEKACGSSMTTTKSGWSTTCWTLRPSVYLDLLVTAPIVSGREIARRLFSGDDLGDFFVLVVPFESYGWQE